MKDIGRQISEYESQIQQVTQDKLRVEQALKGKTN
jgi:hypothetical protein